MFLKRIWIEMESLFFSLMKRTKNQGCGQLWIRGYGLWMKLICLEFEMIYFEMKSLFFCLIKRTKNQGFGIVVKAQISIISWRFSLRALYFVHSWNADFVGDLLRSFRQKSSISVRDQNPTIPRPEVDYELDLVIYKRPKLNIAP